MPPAANSFFLYEHYICLEHCELFPMLSSHPGQWVPRRAVLMA